MAYEDKGTDSAINGVFTEESKTTSRAVSLPYGVHIIEGFVSAEYVYISYLETVFGEGGKLEEVVKLSDPVSIPSGYYYAGYTPLVKRGLFGYEYLSVTIHFSLLEDDADEE